MTNYKLQKPKPEQTKRLTKTLNELQNLEALIKDILDGKLSQAAAARRLNLTAQTFSDDTRLYHQIHQAIDLKKHHLQKLLYDCRTPYEKLLYAIFDLEKDTILVLPEDTNEKLDQMMQKHLTPREYTLICTFFGIPDQEPKSGLQIAREQNCSSTNINAILHKAFRKLRNPFLYKHMLSNYDLYIQSIDELSTLAQRKQELEEACQQFAITKAEIKKLTEEANISRTEIANFIGQTNNPITISDDKRLTDYTVLLSERDLQTLSELKLKTVKDLRNINHEQLAICIDQIPLSHLKSLYTMINIPYPDTTIQLLTMSIDELNLSTRLHNRLARQGIQTVGNVIQHTAQEFKNTRNLGLKSYQELTNKLQQLGFTLKDK